VELSGSVHGACYAAGRCPGVGKSAHPAETGRGYGVGPHPHVRALARRDIGRAPNNQTSSIRRDGGDGRLSRPARHRSLRVPTHRPRIRERPAAESDEPLAVRADVPHRGILTPPARTVESPVRIIQ
jgi:hypothetical protein